MRFATVIICLFLLSACSVRHRLTVSTHAKIDSTATVVKHDSTIVDNSMVTDSGDVFILPVNRPEMATGETVEHYVSDNATKVIFYHKRAQTSHTASVIKDSSAVVVHKNIKADSTKVTSDSTVKANVKTGWIWIFGVILIVGIVVVVFLFHWKIL